MFGLDSDEEAPNVASTFTTRDLVEIPVLREAMAQTARRVRAEVSEEARYGALLEWTTGKATLRVSDGRRRPHLHTLWKGVNGRDVERVESIARDVWKRLTGAHSHVVEEVRSPGAAIRYVALHHVKESQGPPAGWSGRRVWVSIPNARRLGYWTLGAPETRRRAREAASDQRLIYRCERELQNQLDTPNGFPLDVWEELVAERVREARQESSRVELVRVREVEEIDPTTGEVRSRMTKVLGTVA